MKFNAEDITLQTIDDRPYICFRFTTSNLDMCSKIVEKVKNLIKKNPVVQIDILKPKTKRSLDANGYLWSLCEQIAKKLSRPQIGVNPAVTVTKEEVYKKQIQDVGVFEIVPIKNEAVESYIKHWNKRGLGWYAEVLSESKIAGYTNVVTYFGSSVYDTKEMSRLIDGVVQEAKSLDIETATPEQLALLKEEWR